MHKYEKIFDFTKDEIKNMLCLLIDLDISFACEFAELAKERKENIVLLDTVIDFLHLGQKSKAKKILKYYS